MRITIEGADVGCRCGVVEEDDEGREERMDGEAEGETWLSTKLMREHKGAYIIHSLQSFTPLLQQGVSCSQARVGHLIQSHFE